MNINLRGNFKVLILFQNKNKPKMNGMPRFKLVFTQVIDL